MLFVSLAVFVFLLHLKHCLLADRQRGPNRLTNSTYSPAMPNSFAAEGQLMQPKQKSISEMHLSMFGFRSSWSNKGNVLATSLLPSTQCYSTFFFFFYETVDLTEPFLENVKPPGVRSPCISTFPIRTALKGKWKLSTSPVLIYNTNHFFGKYGNVHNNTAQ